MENESRSNLEQTICLCYQGRPAPPMTTSSGSTERSLTAETLCLPSVALSPSTPETAHSSAAALHRDQWPVGFGDHPLPFWSELMDGCLLDAVTHMGCIPETVLRGVARQVLHGLLFLHKKCHVVHRCTPVPTTTGPARLGGTGERCF